MTSALVLVGLAEFSQQTVEAKLSRGRQERSGGRDKQDVATVGDTSCPYYGIPQRELLCY